jgi:hypothetical protein
VPHGSESDPMTDKHAPTSEPVSAPHVRSKVDGWWPQAGTRIQLFSAAILWAIGAAVLLIRGVGFLHDRWATAIVIVAVLIGIAKERYILNKYARKAVKRVHSRGKAFYFGFFAVGSWVFIALMMGGGIALRMSVLASPTDVIPWGRDALAVLYVAVGTGLAYADRIYWAAALAKTPAALDAVENEIDTP